MKLKKGQMYKLKIKNGEDGVTQIKKMRFLEAYRYFALLEDAHGIRECFLWRELRKILVG